MLIYLLCLYSLLEEVDFNLCQYDRDFKKLLGVLNSYFLRLKIVYVAIHLTFLLQTLFRGSWFCEAAKTEKWTAVTYCEYFRGWNE
jgi:hypothetical protein